jgi:hypothetical protein
MKLRSSALAVLAVVLGTVAAWGQSQDVLVPSTQGKTFILGRGMPWGTSGPGGMANTFIVPLTDAQSSYCLFIANNGPGADAPILSVFYTGDPAVSRYTGNTGKWFTLYPGQAQTSIASGTVSNYFIGQPSGSRIAITLSGGSGADTADVYLVRNMSGSGCSGSTSATPNWFSGNATWPLPSSSNVQTAVPLSINSGISTTVTSPASSISSITSVIYAATCYNPNALASFCGFGTTGLSSPAFGTAYVLVPPNSQVTFNIPAKGYLITVAQPLFGICSTGINTAVAPVSSCTINFNTASVNPLTGIPQ